MTLRERFDTALTIFEKEMPIAETELQYDTPFHLLLAVILSAQCTDRRVNMVTPALFEAFPSPESLSSATAEDVYPYIKSVSYPNNKAKLLVGAARKLVELYGGVMPSDIDSLMKLPGVGRKTANVMLAVVFNKAAMAVDAHVFRVSERIGFTTDSKSPLQTEKRLVKYIPEELIPKAHHWLILHGRYVCKARKPECDKCGLTNICRYFKVHQKRDL